MQICAEFIFVEQASFRVLGIFCYSLLILSPSSPRQVFSIDRNLGWRWSTLERSSKMLTSSIFSILLPNLLRMASSRFRPLPASSASHSSSPHRRAPENPAKIRSHVPMLAVTTMMVLTRRIGRYGNVLIAIVKSKTDIEGLGRS